MGYISKGFVREIPGAPIDAQTLEAAGRIAFDRESAENILAFPRLYNRSSPHVRCKKAWSRKAESKWDSMGVVGADSSAS